MVSMLEVTGLSHHYPGRARVPALTDVSFDIAGGRLVFVLGPNGSGKSTLFRIILPLLRATAGAVRVEGMALAQYSTRSLAQVVSYIPQQHDVTFDYTARHTVVLGRIARRGWNATPRPSDWELADQALAQVGISELADRGMRQLSGGERQLVLIARALCQEGRLLVLDEPTSALDAGNQLRVLGQIRDLATQGLTVLLSSHNPSQALQYADDVLLLQGGRAEPLQPAATVGDDALTRLYGIPLRVVTSPEAPGVRLCIAAETSPQPPNDP